MIFGRHDNPALISKKKNDQNLQNLANRLQRLIMNIDVIFGTMRYFHNTQSGIFKMDELFLNFSKYFVRQFAGSSTEINNHFHLIKINLKLETTWNGSTYNCDQLASNDRRQTTNDNNKAAKKNLLARRTELVELNFNEICLSWRPGCDCISFCLIWSFLFVCVHWSAVYQRIAVFFCFSRFGRRIAPVCVSARCSREYSVCVTENRSTCYQIGISILSFLTAVILLFYTHIEFWMLLSRFSIYFTRLLTNDGWDELDDMLLA